MEVFFNSDVAKGHGVNEAIVIAKLQVLIYEEHLSEAPIYENRTWVSLSVKGWAGVFPFWTIAQIRRIFESLLKQDVLIDGNFNKNTHDRTKWYAFKDEQKWLNKISEK